MICAFFEINKRSAVGIYLNFFAQKGYPYSTVDPCVALRLLGFARLLCGTSQNFDCVPPQSGSTPLRMTRGDGDEKAQTVAYALLSPPNPRGGWVVLG